MKYFAWLLGLPLGLVLFVWLTGLLLGSSYNVGAAILTEAPPEAVWNILNEVENYPKWRIDVVSVEVTERKPVLVWVEANSLGNKKSYSNQGSHFPEKWQAVQIENQADLKINRIMHIVAMESGGTQIAVTEEGKITSPFVRFWRRFQAGYAVELEQLLFDLRKRLGE